MTNAELPNLDFSTAALISSAGHPFNILFLKLSTISSLPASLLGILSLAASLCHEVDIGDDHVLADCLAHVVDGEQSDGGSREGFHLHPCLASALHPENRRAEAEETQGSRKSQGVNGTGQAVHCIFKSIFSYCSHIVWSMKMF